MWHLITILTLYRYCPFSVHFSHLVYKTFLLLSKLFSIYMLRQTQILRDNNILSLCYYNQLYDSRLLKIKSPRRDLSPLTLIVYVLYDFYEIKHSVSQQQPANIISYYFYQYFKDFTQHQLRGRQPLLTYILSFLYISITILEVKRSFQAANHLFLCFIS